MSRPRTFDESEVLEGAVALFRERGFDGTSVPELTERLGICRQSLYTAFGDKRGLYLRALERWGEREVDPKLALLGAHGSPPRERAHRPARVRRHGSELSDRRLHDGHRHHREPR